MTKYMVKWEYESDMSSVREKYDKMAETTTGTDLSTMQKQAVLSHTVLIGEGDLL